MCLAPRVFGDHYSKVGAHIGRFDVGSGLEPNGLNLALNPWFL